jgi:hypothetical protein
MAMASADEVIEQIIQTRARRILPRMSPVLARTGPANRRV